MEKIVVAGGYGIIVGDSLADAVISLQILLWVERDMIIRPKDHKLEVAKLLCSMRKVRRLEKLIRKKGSWLYAYPIKAGYVLIFTPCLAFIKCKAEDVSLEEIITCLHKL